MSIKLDKPVTVYNFTVANYHTYYVSDLGIWVHNTNCFKKPISGKSAKEAAKDVPSWAKHYKPYKGQSGTEFAKRLMDDKYGPGNYKTGPDSEFNKIKKWGDRAFEK
ncbi:polymorphic toxin-type HINT domain-containing protein [Bacillus sp. FJAT-27445]|uniref:polymorphic toxin-type HINT domain-containing protein n=1 Tax=Bacillus sp. FJAT-27445 TaxID=1679166 RepID=UPI0007444263|nr:polymorphic toxin-type HINT domain-containing protein [Bacillus sp. FJAT-27445]